MKRLKRDASQRSLSTRNHRRRLLGFELMEDRVLLVGDLQLLKDINTLPSTEGSGTSELLSVGTTLFFRADNRSYGPELWKSDGTLTGTVMVKDISSGSDASLPRYLTNVNGTLFFSASDGSVDSSANDGINGRELWKSDGTEAGTVLVKDILAGSGDSSPRNLTNVNGILYFLANDGINGEELWKSDGTAAGTVLVKDILLGVASSSHWSHYWQ